jgi:hypothetical protein
MTDWELDDAVNALCNRRLPEAPTFFRLRKELPVGERRIMSSLARLKGVGCIAEQKHRSTKTGFTSVRFIALHTPRER